MYLNPSSGRFSVEIPNTKNGDYNVMDAMGRIVCKGSLSNTNKIDITGNKTGIYFLQLTIDNEISVTKLIIE